MKTKILVLSFALALSANLRAQVTIGELSEPTAGALLDLNKATKGGLALSNVKIEHLYEIPVGFPCISTPGDVTAQVKQEFTGAMVYHTGENNIAAGIYVWNGTNWAPVKENCLPLTEANLTLTAPSFAKVNTEVSFSASANTSEICSGGETYSWSVTPAATVQSPSAANTSIQFPAAGTYTVKVKMGNRYTDPATSVPAEKEKIVEITTDGGPTPAMLNSNYGLVGEACLDVLKPNAGQNPAVYAARKPGFPGGSYEKTYKFVHTAAYSDLSLDYIDPSNLVEKITVHPPASAAASGTAVDNYYEKEFKIQFNSNIQDLVPDDGNFLSVQLIASYKPDGSTETKLAYLEIRVEDGTCVCPAKISATQWKNFACHNLGGEDILSSSQLITRAHHGDWYRWGAKTVSVQNLDATTDNSPAGWNDETNASAPYTPYYQDSQTYGSGVDWIAANDPCPAGWRLPVAAELAGLVSTSNNSWIGVGPWGGHGNTQFGNVKKVGDYLYLPAAGNRNTGNGSMRYRGGNGSYWSNSANGSYGKAMNFSGGNQNLDIYIARSYGYSVRCVAVE
jgi:uncharacterized protein (TIGR02145 family)